VALLARATEALALLGTTFQEIHAIGMAETLFENAVGFEEYVGSVSLEMVIELSSDGSWDMFRGLCSDAYEHIDEGILT
jgi:hypothetical protein